MTNAIGAAAFLIVAAISWTEPELRDIPGASGGSPFVWFFTAIPIVLLFMLLNGVVVLWAYLVRRKRGVWPVSKFLWLSLPVWLLALVIDSAHH